MKEQEFYQSSYHSSVEIFNNKLSVSKEVHGDWTYLELIVNDNDPERITINSQQMLEHLHFMLGQLLDK